MTGCIRLLLHQIVMIGMQNIMTVWTITSRYADCQHNRNTLKTVHSLHELNLNRELLESRLKDGSTFALRLQHAFKTDCLINKIRNS